MAMILNYAFPLIGNFNDDLRSVYENCFLTCVHHEIEREPKSFYTETNQTSACNYSSETFLLELNEFSTLFIDFLSIAFVSDLQSLPASEWIHRFQSPFLVLIQWRFCGTSYVSTIFDFCMLYFVNDFCFLHQLIFKLVIIKSLPIYNQIYLGIFIL